MTKQIEYKGYIIKASTSEYKVLRNGKLALLNYDSFKEAEEDKKRVGVFGRCRTIKDGILYGKLIVDTILGNIPKKALLRKMISNIYKAKRKKGNPEFYRYKLEQFIAKYPDFDISIYPEVFELALHWEK